MFIIWRHDRTMVKNHTNWMSGPWNGIQESCVALLTKSLSTPGLTVGTISIHCCNFTTAFMRLDRLTFIAVTDYQLRGWKTNSHPAANLPFSGNWTRYRRLCSFGFVMCAGMYGYCNKACHKINSIHKLLDTTGCAVPICIHSFPAISNLLSYMSSDFFSYDCITSNAYCGYRTAD